MKKNKRLLIIGIISIVIMVSIIFIIENNKYNMNKMKEDELKQGAFSTERINNQTEVSSLITKYASSIKTLKDYAKSNKRKEFSVFDFKNIFSIDISEFELLPYDCDINGSFIRYKDDYSKYIIIMDCKDFYIR